MYAKWSLYGGMICKKKDIQKEAKLKHFNPNFNDRDTHTEQEAKQKDKLGLWCENCQQISVHECIGRSQKHENTYKCNRCGLQRRIVWNK